MEKNDPFRQYQEEIYQANRDSSIKVGQLLDRTLEIGNQLQTQMFGRSEYGYYKFEVEFGPSPFSITEQIDTIFVYSCTPDGVHMPCGIFYRGPKLEEINTETGQVVAIDDDGDRFIDPDSEKYQALVDILENAVCVCEAGPAYMLPKSPQMVAVSDIQ